MKLIAALLFAQLVTVIQPAAAEDAPSRTMSAASEKCIRDNAAQVERAVPDLQAGVDFLIKNVCAQPFAQEAIAFQKKQSEALRSRLEKQCASMKAEKSSPVSEDVTPDFCANAAASAAILDDQNEGWTLYAVGAYPGIGPSPDATALAARLLLDLRSARKAP